MSVTISTHNGTTFSREHNIRNRNVTDKEKHINPKGPYEIWHDEKIRDAYHRIFDAAVEKYNEKQQREERRIKNYYRDVCKDAGKNAAYELIVGVYGPDCSTETKKEILKEFFTDWGRRNPNLELIGAYFHFDEEGKDPHLHIDYIPVAHGYKKGMETQVGLNRALYEQDGFQTENRHNTAQVKWEKRENAYLESLCVAHGLTVDHPMIGKAEHLATEEFKAKKVIEEAEKIKKDLEFVRAEYESKKEYVQEMTKDMKFPPEIKEKRDHVIIPKNTWIQQQITKMDIQAQEIARERWEKMVEYYPEIIRDIENLRLSNERRREDLNKFENTISKMSPEAQKEFWELYKETSGVQNEKEKELIEKVFEDR